MVDYNTYNWNDPNGVASAQAANKAAYAANNPLNIDYNTATSAFSNLTPNADDNTFKSALYKAQNPTWDQTTNNYLTAYTPEQLAAYRNSYNDFNSYSTARNASTAQANKDVVNLIGASADPNSGTAAAYKAANPNGATPATTNAPQTPAQPATPPPAGVSQDVWNVTTKFTQQDWQQVARNAGYTGPMGGGEHSAWVAADTTGQRQRDYNAALAKYTTENAAKFAAATAATGNNTAVDAQGKPISQVMADMATNPQLAPGASMQPILQSVQGNELLTGQSSTLTDGANTYIPPGTQVNAQNVTTATGTAAQTNPNDATSQVNPASATYEASQSGTGAQGTAEQGTVNPLSTVQGQLAELYSQIQFGEIPQWARGSVNAANEYLAAKNMSASSIGATAIQGAIQGQALNIAAADSATYFQMDLKNLDNRQQMALENLKNRQQSLLTDVAAQNVAKQFNAQSESQTQQFMATLVSNINNQNADRLTAMSQFNAGQANQVATTNAANDLTAQTFNAQQKQAIDAFNANLANQREQFNATNAFAIEQSNVLWRRSVNTANTASINAANQVNVQNKFNLSSTALNNIWQQYRDEAAWLFTASENQKTRDYNVAMNANNRQLVSDNTPDPLISAATSFATSLLLG